MYVKLDAIGLDKVDRLFVTKFFTSLRTLCHAALNEDVKITAMRRHPVTSTSIVETKSLTYLGHNFSLNKTKKYLSSESRRTPDYVICMHQ